MSDPSPLPGAPGLVDQPDLVLALTNVPDAQAAERIARALVEERLAACVNALAPCRSTYRWQGAVEQAEEIPLLIKTTGPAWAAAARRLRELHPYDVPEIVAWRPRAVAADYLAWAIGETVPGAPPDQSSSQRAASSAK